MTDLKTMRMAAKVHRKNGDFLCEVKPSGDPKAQTIKATTLASLAESIRHYAKTRFADEPDKDRQHGWAELFTWARSL
jgi:hypothetical protein